MSLMLKDKEFLLFFRIIKMVLSVKCLKGVLLFCGILTFRGICADVLEEERATFAEFITPYEVFFAKNREHFIAVVDQLSVKNIYRLRSGQNRLWIQLKEKDDVVTAPDALNDILFDHFKALGLLGATSADGVVQLGPAGGFPEFNGNVLVHSFDYLRDGRKNEILCEENTIESTPEGGYCLWPLGEPNWFAKFIWVDQRDKSIWP